MDMVMDEFNSPKSRRAINRLQWKRFFVLSVCFYPCYAAFRGLRDLQSTLNSMQGLGLASLTILNTCGALAGLFAPALVRLKIGTKWSFVLGSSLFAVYTLSNYYASAALLLPAAVLPGVGSAFLFVSRGTIITALAKGMAGEENPAAYAALLHGIFSAVSRLSTLTGNAISSAVLNEFYKSRTLNISLDLESCGRFACGGDSLGNGTALVPVDQAIRTLLISVYLGLGLIATFVAIIFLERIPSKSAVTHEGAKLSASKTAMRGIMVTFRLMKRPYMVLLIPQWIFYGGDIAFASGHFTKLFVGCVHGVSSVGYVIMSLYITCAIFCPLVGRLVKYTGRVPVFIVGGTVYLMLLIIMLCWDPTEGQLWPLFALASGLGFTRAITSTITMTLVSVLFPDQQEAAFGNVCFWQSIGVAIISAIGIPDAICGIHVLIVMMSLLVLVMILYIVVELKLKREYQQHPGVQYDSAVDTEEHDDKQDHEMSQLPVTQSDEIS